MAHVRIPDNLLRELRPLYLTIFESRQEEEKKKNVSDNEIALRIIVKVWEESKRRKLI